MQLDTMLAQGVIDILFGVIAFGCEIPTDLTAQVHMSDVGRGLKTAELVDSARKFLLD